MSQLPECTDLALVEATNRKGLAWSTRIIMSALGLIRRLLDIRCCNVSVYHVSLGGSYRHESFVVSTTFPLLVGTQRWPVGQFVITGLPLPFALHITPLEGYRVPVEVHGWKFSVRYAR